MVLAVVVAPSSQVSVPNVFSSGNTIKSADVNSNFTIMGNHALDRISGGNISGNVTMDALVTIDGIDLSVALCPACATTHASLTLTSGNLTANGIGILSAGKIPALSSSYFASVSGANLTSLNGTQVTSGTVPPAQLGSGSPSATTYLRGDSTWVTLYRPIIRNTSTGITAVANDFIVGSTGGYTITLPAAASNPSGVVEVKNVSTAVITIARAGADLIDGATTATISQQYHSLTLISDGVSNWWVK